MHLRDSFRLKATSSLSPWLEDRASVCRLYSHRGAPAVLAQRGIPDFPICGQSGPRFPFPAESGNGGSLPVSPPNRESGERELGISGSDSESDPCHCQKLRMIGLYTGLRVSEAAGHTEGVSARASVANWALATQKWAFPRT